MSKVYSKLNPYIKSGLVFKILYLLLTLFAFNSLTANSNALSIGSYFVTVVGAIYFCYRLLHYNSYIKTKGLIILALFVVSYVISSVYTIQYGVGENIKAVIWMAMQFFLLYAYDSKMSKQQIKKESSILAAVFLGYTFIFSFLSILCVVFNYSHIRHVNGTRVITGLLWGRLWGLYSDPNYGGVFALISLVISVFLFVKTRRKLLKGFSAVNGILQIMYMGFSDSRTAIVGVLATFFIMAVLYTVKNNRLAKLKMSLRVTVTILLVLAITVTPVLLSKSAVYIGNQYLSAISSIEKSPSDQPEDVNENVGATEEEKTETDNAIGRTEESLSGDPSNRRFSIWKSAVEIAKTSPVIGVSFRNLFPYAQDTVPDTYIVSNDYHPFTCMHNVFMDTMVSQGAVGVILLAAFVIIVLKHVLSKLFRKTGEDYEYCALLVCIILPIAISAMFYSEILYINTGGSVIFWTALGYLMNYISHKDSSEESHSKVGILTFHRARNYGANLQALGSQHALNKLGYEAEIIDYKPDYIEDSFGIVIPSLREKYGKGLGGIIRFAIDSVLHLPWRVVKENNFRSFWDKRYKLSDECFENKENLEKHLNKKEEYKTVFIGSDQIWNKDLTRGIDGIFYGENFPATCTKASLAASIGAIDFTEEEKTVLTQKLKGLDFLSVREKKAKAMISPLTDKEVSVTADPTLLLEREEWEQYCVPVKMKKEYICAYALELSPQFISFVNKLAVKENLPVVFFDIKNRYGCKAYSKFAANPLEFISYIKEAKYVVTNSFHGTIFSLMFEKQFVCIPNYSNRGRAEQLLEDTGLECRLADENLEVSVMYEPIDFTRKREVISEKRKEALDYIQNVLNCSGAK